MTVTTNVGSVVAQPGQQYTLGSLFTITPGSVQSIELTGLDRNEYTAASTGSEGTISGNGQTIPVTSTTGSDHESFSVVFTYNALTGQYTNSTYGDFSSLVFTASTDNYRNQYLSILTPYGYGWTDAADLNIVTRPNYTNPYAGAIPGQATPNSIAAVAQSFVGQAWNMNGCWVLASNIAAAAGSSLPLTANYPGSTPRPNGEWVCVYDGTTQLYPTLAAAEAVVRPGDMVAMGWTFGSGHITTVVSGYGAQAQVVDNLVNGHNWANDGSNSDVTITSPHSLASTLTGNYAGFLPDPALPYTVQVYRLDTPIVAQGSVASAVGGNGTPLANLFSVSDPANRAITEYCVYDSGNGSLVVNGIAQTANSAATAITLTSSALGCTSLRSTGGTGTDSLTVRAYNGSYWGDWQTVQVGLGGTAPTPTNCVDAFVATQNASGRGAAGIAFEFSGTSVTAGNSVIGLQSATFTSGYDAMVLSGPRSQYGIYVDGTDTAYITDLTTHQTVTDRGLSYLVFNGGATTAANGITSYNSIYFVQNAGDSQIASFYAAALGRQPDLSGLEYWQNQYVSGGSTTTVLSNIAQCFINSSEFLSRYPSASAPADQGGVNDTAFVNALYQNVLGRPADSSGLAYWVQSLHDAEVGGLTGTQARANVLLNFTGSTENLQHIGAANGGWLIDTAQGSYSDTNGFMPPSVVLTQAGQTHVLNTSQLNLSSMTTSLSVGNFYLSAPPFSSMTISGFGTPYTVTLSSAVNSIYVDMSGCTINGSSAGGSYMNLWAINTTITLHGTGNTIDSTYCNATTINGFTTGNVLRNDDSGSLLATQVLAPTTAAPLYGNTLTFGSSSHYVNVGNVGTGTAAEMAAAANLVYVVADHGTTSSTGFIYGESLVFFGQSGNNTVLFDWHGYGTTADTNSNHLVDASELTGQVILVGVQASTLTSSMLR